MGFYIPLLLVCCKVGIIIVFFTIMTVWGLNIYMKYKSPLNLDCNMVYDSEEHIYEEDKKILSILILISYTLCHEWHPTWLQGYECSI